MKGISGISQKDVDAFRTRYLMYGVDSGSVCRNATLSKIALEKVKDIYIAEDFYRMYNPGL